MTDLETKIATRPATLPALTGARFVAAASVVGYHYQSVMHCPAWLDPLLGSGRSGVSFFYILSGFILTYNYKSWFTTDTKRWKAFAEARLARVYPMYFVSMVLALAILLGWNLPRYRALVEASAYTHITTANLAGSFVVDTLCLQPLMPSPEVELLWNTANWSIPCELFFYLCFPIFLVWLSKRALTRRGLVLMAAGIYALQSLVFISLAAGIAHFWNPASAAWRLTATRNLATDLLLYRSPVIRVGEFAVGVIVGLLYLEEHSRLPSGSRFAWKRTAEILICLLGIGFFAYLEVPPALSHAMAWLRAFTVFTPLYAMLILLLARGETLFAHVLSWRPIELLGESSYSLYLIHTPILSLLVFKSRSGREASGAEIAAYLGVTLILSIICFKLIETPARKKWRSLSLKRSAKPIPDARLTA